MVGLTSNNLMNLSMAERFDKFREKGFGSVMIWLGPDAKESADERATLAERAGLFIENFHLSCDHLNEMWIDCKEGDERISRFKDEIAAASKHGVKTVVCHLSHGDFPPFVSTIGTNRIEDLVKFAENANVKLAFENVITKDHVTYVLENFKSPYVGLCYDVGHDHYWRVQDWLGLFGDRVFALHLHDNFADKDSHFIPFDGSIDWQYTLPRLAKTSYRGTTTLETKDAAYVYDASPDKYLEHALSVGNYIDKFLENNR